MADDKKSSPDIKPASLKRTVEFLTNEQIQLYKIITKLTERCNYLAIELHKKNKRI